MLALYQDGEPGPCYLKNSLTSILRLLSSCRAEMSNTEMLDLCETSVGIEDDGLTFRLNSWRHCMLFRPTCHAKALKLRRTNKIVIS